MLTQNVYTLTAGSATTVVAPTTDAAHYVLKNLEPAPDADDYARHGLVYIYGNNFTVNSGSSVLFSFTTGSTGAQIQFYEILTTVSDIKAELIEGATIVTNGSAIPAYNLNRNASDNHEAVLQAATSITGGVTISSEYITGSNQAGSEITIAKIHTLEPNTQYGFKFTGVGAQNTTVFFQVAWSEKYNGYNDIWLGTVNNSFVLHGGEETSMYLQPYEVINATPGSTGCQLAVIRQD